MERACEARPFAPRPGRPQRVTLPPDRVVQPISERQFAAVVRGFERQDDGGVAVYRRAGRPLVIRRDGDCVVVSDGEGGARYYVIV